MPTSWKHRFTIAALRCLPKNLLSRLVGRAASWHLPGFLQQLEILAFGRAVGVDFAEVRDPIDSFRSLQEFFVRQLQDGARPIDSADDALVAPCDGYWGAAGRIDRGTLLQVKGRPYTVAALLGDGGRAEAFENGVYATFYLSPRDYHRFHSPCATVITRAVYLPGSLWPVNEAGTHGIEGLFAVNERISAYMTIGEKEHRGSLCLVPVGATLVGKIRLTFDDLTTNLPRSGRVERDYPEPGHRLEKGEEWGRFEFGSTIVLLATEHSARLNIEPAGTPIRLGRRIGTLLDAP
jgi:phosphatidylserine decarboxylase